jgi:hypothetical protein
MTRKSDSGGNLWWEEGVAKQWEADEQDTVPSDIVWIDGSGRRTPVADLEDVHLMNIIRMVARMDDERAEYLAMRALQTGNLGSAKRQTRAMSRRDKLLLAVPVLPYLEKEARRRGFRVPEIADDKPLPRRTVSQEVIAPIEFVPEKPKQKKRRDVAKQSPDTRAVDVRRFAMLELPDDD